MATQVGTDNSANRRRKSKNSVVCEGCAGEFPIFSSEIFSGAAFALDPHHSECYPRHGTEGLQCTKRIEADFESQRRRSERISQPFPLVVRGIDLLGQPFEERTSGSGLQSSRLPVLLQASSSAKCVGNSGSRRGTTIQNVQSARRLDPAAAIGARFFPGRRGTRIASEHLGARYPPEDWRLGNAL